MRWRLVTVRGRVVRSMTELVTPVPLTLSRLMLVRNSRVPGSIEFRAAGISATAAAAETVS
jgi:hypothetical protein